MRYPHICSYYCERPKCVRAQRDNLRDKVDKLTNQRRVLEEVIILGMLVCALCGAFFVAEHLGAK